MKKIIALSAWILLSAFAISCKHEKVESDPLTDGKPRIISIVFPGILRENVSIDQKNFLITVKSPSVLLPDMEPEVEITENAQLLQKIYEGTFFGGGPPNTIPLTYKGGHYAVVTYKARIIPNGRFEVGVMKSPIEYILHDDPSPVILVPIVNLYGNDMPKTVELVHRATQETILVDSSRINAGIGPAVNHLTIYMDGLKNQLPGAYDIFLKMADGKTFRVPQPLIQTKGPAVLSSYQSNFYFGEEAKVNSTFYMEGYNLFKGDITVELIDRRGIRIPIDGLVFERYGLRLGIPIPANLPPDQYVMKLYQFGKTRGTCFRINVRKGSKPENRIGTIGDDPLPCLLQDPVRIERNTNVLFTYAIGLNTPNFPRIKLTPATGAEGSRIYYGSVVPYILPNPNGPSRLTISEDVPAGLYSATLQYLNSDGQVEFETEPYGQLLEVY